MEGLNSNLDEVQSGNKDYLLTLAEAAKMVSEIQSTSFFEALYAHPRLDRHASAVRVRNSIAGVGNYIRDIALSIGDISTAAGTVHPSNGDQYLQEELERLKHIDHIRRWKRIHASLRKMKPMNYVDGRVNRNEFGVVNEALEVLYEDLSGMNAEEECLRAALLIEEIRGNYWRITKEILSSPIRIGKELGAVVITAGTIAGSFFGGVTAGLAGTVAQLGYSAVRANVELRQFDRVSSDAKQQLRNQLPHNKALVERSLMSAGIFDPTEQVLDLDE